MWMGFGTGKTSFPPSSTYSALIGEPLFSGAPTTRTLAERDEKGKTPC